MKNPNGCTGERCPLVNIPDAGCKATGCPWFTEDYGNRTIYGFPIRELAVLAEACRLQGITPEELHGFVLNLGTAIEIVYKSMQEQWDKAIKKAFGTDGTIDQEG